MSDNLIKDEAEFIRNTATDIETGEPLDDDEMCNMYVIDAHRIADLIDAVEESNKELTLQLEAARHDADEAEAYAWQLEQHLAKAVEALRELDRRNDSLDTFNNAVHEIVSTVLAELEGGE
jgi:hypothetical protein